MDSRPGPPSFENAAPMKMAIAMGKPSTQKAAALFRAKSFKSLRAIVRRAFTGGSPL